MSEVCAPAGFISKKSKKLWFLINFTWLNKYIERPVHSFPSTDQIQQAIRHDTRYMACVDFPLGYFQLRLDKESQGLTVFNTKFGRYLFLRALHGLFSSGDAFNVNTDRFYSGLGKTCSSRWTIYTSRPHPWTIVIRHLGLQPRKPYNTVIHGAFPNSLRPGLVTSSPDLGSS